MSDIDFILIIELIGTVAYAVSGSMVGIYEHMDLFGVVTLGITTSVGGGLIRDTMLGKIPPVMFTNPVYALTALIISNIVFIPAIRKRINPDSMILWMMDAVGLGAFVVVGVRAAMNVSGNVFMASFLGLCTGVGGGVLRDIFAGKKPMIFTKHFYATPALIGSIICAVIFPHSELYAMLFGGIAVIVLRVFAIIFKWHFPKAN